MLKFKNYSFQVVIVCAAFGVDVGTQLMPLWSAFIAASFIFGGSAKDAFESIIFVFVTVSIYNRTYALQSIDLGVSIRSMLATVYLSAQKTWSSRMLVSMYPRFCKLPHDNISLWLYNISNRKKIVYRKWDGSVMYIKNSVLSTLYIINVRRTGPTGETIGTLSYANVYKGRMVFLILLFCRSQRRLLYTYLEDA